MATRQRISAALRDFRQELKRLRSLDKYSQSRLASSSGRPEKDSLSKKQLHLIAEGIFLSAYRAHENFTEEIFLLYCMGKLSPSGLKARKSYLLPKTYQHAEEMIKSSQPFLDWSSPDLVLKRSELYLRDGYPIKQVYVSNMQILRKLKSLRNHVVHNSRQSKTQFIKILRADIKTIPTKIPTPGEFILMNDPNNTGNCFLHTYLDAFENLAKKLGQ